VAQALCLVLSAAHAADAGDGLTLAQLQRNTKQQLDE
jgi:hypothetical protein